MPESILFQESDHPNYNEKRKALSGAFFKQKLIGMTMIMKEVSLRELKRLQDENVSEVDLAQMTMDFYSKIIVNVCVGSGHSKMQIPFEKDDASII
jgi:cytochrome P450